MNLSFNNGKWILVTGGAKGIGRAVSEKLASAGYSLILVGRDQQTLQLAEKAILSIARDFSAESQSRMNAAVFVEWVTADLSAEGAVGQLFRAIRERGIPVPDGVVCNAGDYGTLGPLSEVNGSDWKKSFDLNFFSTVEIIQCYLKWADSVPRAQRRKIILMSGGGLGGSQVWPGISAYSCAKAALYRLMEVVHEEIYQKGYDINCVAPGAVKTGITDQAERAGEKALGRLYEATLKVQVNGGDSPQLAADTVLRLLSPSCEGLSGRLISAKWDRKFLENPSLVTGDPDLLRLRRIDAELFKKN